MTDPSDTAGNLADLVKQVLLCRVAAAWAERHAGSSWVETHAGRFLHPEGTWRAEEAVHTRLAAPLPEPWSAAAGPWLAQGTWPGSLAVVGDVAPDLVRMGFERDPERAATFEGSGVSVRAADGFASAPGVVGDGVVVCDPFWDEEDTLARVAALRDAVPHLVVWYPVLPGLEGAALHGLGMDVVEVDWPAQGRRVRGAGLAFHGIDDGAWWAWQAWRDLARCAEGRVALSGRNWLARGGGPLPVWG